MLKIALPLLLGLAAFAEPGHAAPTEVVARVTYSDLNLAAEEGVRTLDRRLERAIDSICENEAGVLSKTQIRSLKRCKAQKHAQVASQRRNAIAAARPGNQVAVSGY